MKISVKEGIGAEEAFEKVVDYLRKIINEYPVLNSNMNIYITLKDEENRVCPMNDDSIMITKGKAESIYDKIRTKAVHICNKRMECTIERIEAANRSVDSRMYAAKRNVANAQKRGFATVEKWREAIRNLEKEKENIPEREKLCSSIRENIKRGNITYEIKVEYDAAKNRAAVLIRPVIKGIMEKETLYYYDFEFSPEDRDEEKWPRLSFAM